MSYQNAGDERELLRSASIGDERAFRILFYRYHRLLGTHIVRITKSAEVAEEVVQDVFLKIWLNRETLDEIENFRAYLYVAGKNHALNLLKKAAKERAVSIESARLLVENFGTEDAEQREYDDLMDEAIDHLPPQQQKVYLLSRHEQLKYKEIAARLDLSTETVKKYLQLATESITRHLKKSRIWGYFPFF